MRKGIPQSPKTVVLGDRWSITIIRHVEDDVCCRPEEFNRLVFGRQQPNGGWSDAMEVSEEEFKEIRKVVERVAELLG